MYLFHEYTRILGKKQNTVPRVQQSERHFTYYKCKPMLKRMKNGLLPKSAASAE